MLVDATIRALKMHSELYERAAAFRGHARERIVALGEADELFIRLYPQHHRALQVVRIAGQLNAPRPSEDALARCESRVIGMLSDIVQNAVGTGHLELPTPRHADELAFTVWALAFGTRALMNTRVANSQLRVDDAPRVLRGAADLLFDGLGWRPLSSQWDYEHTRWRVHSEIFKDEWLAAFAA